MSIPHKYQQQLNERVQTPTDDEIKTALPDDLKEKDLVVGRVRNLLSNQKARIDKALLDFDDLRATCIFTVSNNGYKEAVDIKLELPRKGVFSLEKLGEPRIDDKFENIISIGKLNPGGEATVTTWNTDYMGDISPWEEEKFRVTHTNGLAYIEFLPHNTTFLGEIYESYPNTAFITLVIIMVGGFIIGWFSGANEEKKKKGTRKKSEAESTSPSDKKSVLSDHGSQPASTQPAENVAPNIEEPKQETSVPQR